MTSSLPSPVTAYGDTLVDPSDLISDSPLAITKTFFLACCLESVIFLVLEAVRARRRLDSFDKIPDSVQERWTGSQGTPKLGYLRVYYFSLISRKAEKEREMGMIYISFVEAKMWKG
jgi:hypothetical protein